MLYYLVKNFYFFLFSFLDKQRQCLYKNLSYTSKRNVFLGAFMEISALLRSLIFISAVLPFASNAQNETNCFYISLKPEIIAKTDVLIKKYGREKKHKFHDS